MRTELKKFRVGLHLTQAEFAEKVGISTATYIKIEKGKTSGNYKFWKTVCTVFGVSDEKMWQLQQID